MPTAEYANQNSTQPCIISLCISAIVRPALLLYALYLCRRSVALWPCISTLARSTFNQSIVSSCLFYRLRYDEVDICTRRCGGACCSTGFCRRHRNRVRNLYRLLDRDQRNGHRDSRHSNASSNRTHDNLHYRFRRVMLLQGNLPTHDLHRHRELQRNWRRPAIRLRSLGLCRHNSYMPCVRRDTRRGNTDDPCAPSFFARFPWIRPSASSSLAYFWILAWSLASTFWIRQSRRQPSSGPCCSWCIKPTVFW